MITDAMKWFIIVAVAAVFLIMAIAMVISTVPPDQSSSDPITVRMNAYNDCLRKSPQGWDGVTDTEINTCKQLVYQGATQN